MFAAMTQRGWLALTAGALILAIAMGIRQSFGLFMTPMCGSLGMGRDVFGLAMAVQNLLWGLAQPVAGAVADTWGSMRVLLLGTVTYAGALMLMATAESTWDVHLGGGVLIGFAMSCVSFSVILGAVGRLVSAEKRSMALGVVSAGGSLGQFIVPPLGQALIAGQGWPGALSTMAFIVLLLAPLAFLLGQRLSQPAGAPASPSPAPTAPAAPAAPQRLSSAVAEAGRHSGYWFLNLGFFVCGFQVVFIAVHLPAYLGDMGLSTGVAALALALIGFFNIIGTWVCGVLGGRRPKKYLLASLYGLRSLVIVVFLAVPKTEATVLIFAALMGLLWLGTVPLTSGLVAHIFGVRYMSTLFGVVFFSHQVGSFLGVWLGGVVFDATGSYDAIWIASVLLGLAAAALHLPIAERPLSPARA